MLVRVWRGQATLRSPLPARGQVLSARRGRPEEAGGQHLRGAPLRSLRAGLMSGERDPRAEHGSTPTLSNPVGNITITPPGEGPDRITSRPGPSMYRS